MKSVLDKLLQKNLKKEPQCDFKDAFFVVSRGGFLLKLYIICAQPLTRGAVASELLM